MFVYYNPNVYYARYFEFHPPASRSVMAFLDDAVAGQDVASYTDMMKILVGGYFNITNTQSTRRMKKIDILFGSEWGTQFLAFMLVQLQIIMLGTWRRIQCASMTHWNHLKKYSRKQNLMMLV